ncbi:A disintegrin and metalloproteinase with thrombospondin motifs 6-like [Montipora foliosa]|uniref:A disintegrin and metalloproteinase with thrombospondin motifs 6-like n=1 Tax=Montipora foliosa TaxID=591990 RepID=UPI0035F1CAC4
MMFSRLLFKIFALLFLPGVSANVNEFPNLHNLLTPNEKERIFGAPFLRGVPDYHVTHPVEVDKDGKFLSDLSNGNHRKRRDLESAMEEPVFYYLSAFGQNLYLNVSMNGKLLSPNFVVEVRGNRKSEFPSDVKHCHYTGHAHSTEGLEAKVALSNCDGLRGIILTADDAFVINPLPDRLRQDNNNTRAHLIHKRSVSALENLGTALGVEKRSENWCGVEDMTNGYSKREVFDMPTSVNYNQEYTIETLVVADKKMVDFHGVEELKTYVPSLINIVHSLLGDSSIGANIKYVLHKLLILEHDQEGLVISSHAGNTMDSFCEWAKGQNPVDDKNPDHFDHAALISRYDFCRNLDNQKGQSCEKVLGLAQVQGMCSLTGSCTLSKDGGLGTAFTIAHETGHNLGAQHDGAANPCVDRKNIMATKASGKQTAFEWSSCSRRAIHAFLSGDGSSCLNDKPRKAVTLPKRLPGEVYTADDQCSRAFGDKSHLCSAPFLQEKICLQLWCVKPETGMCTTHHEPAAEGTNCGHKMWCRRGTCVPYGSEGPEAVDGGYGHWGEWSNCSHSCGGGLRNRKRLCDNPKPQHGGKICQGHSAEFKYCHTPKCPAGVPSPRAEQCAAKRLIRFVDGNKYQWTYNAAIPVIAGQECKLSCIAEVGIRQFAKFSFGHVDDGTRCDDFDENSGLCINGKCQPLGCDKVFGSSKVFDRCGVCDGDGTLCIGKRFTYKGFPNPMKGHYQPIGFLPEGARNIQIKEMRGFKNYLAMMVTSGKDLLNMDFRIKPRSFNFVGAGTRFKYTRDDLNREKITAQGPLTKDVELLYLVQSWKEEYEVRIRYLFPNPSQKVADTEFVRGLELHKKVSFKWTLRSLGCSESCGGGIELIKSICVREDDESMVSDHFCTGRRPDDETIECNTKECPARWKTGEWTDCSKTCNDGHPGKRTREVICTDESHGIEIEVQESHCKESKPTSYETCAIQACPAEWITVKSGPCSATCGRGIREIEVVCVKTTESKVKEPTDDKECEQDKPPTKTTCNTWTPC